MMLSEPGWPEPGIWKWHACNSPRHHRQAAKDCAAQPAGTSASQATVRESLLRYSTPRLPCFDPTSSNTYVKLVWLPRVRLRGSAGVFGTNAGAGD